MDWSYIISPRVLDFLQDKVCLTAQRLSRPIDWHIKAFIQDQAGRSARVDICDGPNWHLLQWCTGSEDVLIAVVSLCASIAS